MPVPTPEQLRAETNESWQAHILDVLQGVPPHEAALFLTLVAASYTARYVAYNGHASSVEPPLGPVVRHPLFDRPLGG